MIMQELDSLQIEIISVSDNSFLFNIFVTRQLVLDAIRTQIPLVSPALRRRSEPFRPGLLGNVCATQPMVISSTQIGIIALVPVLIDLRDNTMETTTPKIAFFLAQILPIMEILQLEFV